MMYIIHDNTLGNKCRDCGSYNTVQEKGGYLRRSPDGTMVKATLIPGEPGEPGQESDQEMDQEDEDHEDTRLDHEDLTEMRIEEGIDAVAQLGTLTPPDTPVRDDRMADRTFLSLGKISLISLDIEYSL